MKIKNIPYLIFISECPADSRNKFYGVKGALRCLLEPDSNVAFIEGQNLAGINSYIIGTYCLFAKCL